MVMHVSEAMLAQSIADVGTGLHPELGTAGIHYTAR